MPLSLQTMGGFRAVTTLPADASTYGPRVLYYKYPVVASLPATVVNDARYVLDATKVEYLGRSVVELEGSDNISLPVLDEYFGNFAEIKVNFRDLVSGGPPTGSRVFLEAGAIVCYVLDTGDFWVDLINTSGYQGSVGVIGVNICDGLNHQLTINFTDTCVFITADGVQSSCITTDGFSYNPIAYIHVNTADDISPLQICCIQQSLNGVLIDSIPCDETTGTTLRNTVSPDRPATLSDATAHALAWVAQSAPTLTVWMWEQVWRFDGTATIAIEERLFDLNTDCVIEFELYDDVVDAWEQLIADRAIPTLNKSFILGRNSNTHNLSVESFGATIATFVDALNITNFTRFKLVKSGNSYSLYKNEILVSTSVNTDSTDVEGTHVIVGASSGGYCGLLKCLKVSSALGSLIWKAKDIIGGVAYDTSGNGNNGVVTGVTLENAWVPT